MYTESLKSVQHMETMVFSGVPRKSIGLGGTSQIVVNGAHVQKNVQKKVRNIILELLLKNMSCNLKYFNIKTLQPKKNFIHNDYIHSYRFS